MNLPIARIYKLINEDSLEYYGSTTEKHLSNRLAKHKSGAKKGTHMSSKVLFENGKTVRIELVENCEVKDRYELRNRERFYVENNDCVNKRIPNRTKKESYEKNKEHFQEYNKEWRKNNLHRVCECGFTGLKQHHARHLKSKKHLEWVASQPVVE